MDQKQYNSMRNQYRRGERGSSLSYRADRNYRANYPKKENEYLPYSVFFRLRMILCIVLFLSFIFADRFVLKKEETTRIYQALEETTTGEGWKEYVADTFAKISKANQK